jgi:hypothetical protein
VNANAQALINISRKRLCNDAHHETRNKWADLVRELDDDAVASACVPECVYRGFCPSLSPCGYSMTAKYEDRLRSYRAGAKSSIEKDR